MGHSYGGLFAIGVALAAPDLFDGYVIVSPSLWYDDGMIFGEEQRLAEYRDDLPLPLYLGVGSREINRQHDMVTDLRRLASRLKGRGYPGLRLRSEGAPDETHHSMFPRAFSNGLRFVVDGNILGDPTNPMSKPFVMRSAACGSARGDSS